MPIIAHISGPSGSGKSTLGKDIYKEHPEIAWIDLDKIDHMISKKFKIEDKNELSDEDWKNFHGHRQALFDAWAKFHANKPKLVVGLHTEGETAYDIPAKHKLMLDLGPVKSTFRAYKRNLKSGNPIKIRDLLTYYKYAKKDQKDLKNLGYKMLPAHEIKQIIKNELNGNPLEQK